MGGPGCLGGWAVPGEREEDVGRETRPSLRPAALHHSPHPALARPAAELQGTLNKRCLETTADGDAGRCSPVVVKTDWRRNSREWELEAGLFVLALWIT